MRNKIVTAVEAFAIIQSGNALLRANLCPR
jgi:hypothetical protein